MVSLGEAEALTEVSEQEFHEAAQAHKSGSKGRFSEGETSMKLRIGCVVVGFLSLAFSWLLRLRAAALYVYLGTTSDPVL